MSSKWTTGAGFAALMTASVLAASSFAAGTTPSAVPLRVELRALSGTNVEVTVTNESRQTLRLPKWQLPTAAAINSDLFDVRIDGRQLRYRGADPKRAVPGPADFAVLRPGQSIRATVDLGSVYEMSATGAYSVAYSAPLQYASFSGGRALKLSNGNPAVAQSAPLQVWVDSRSAADIAQRHQARRAAFISKRMSVAAKLSGVTGVTYTSCSTSQQSALDKAVAAARNYSQNSRNYLNAGKTGPRYTTWFGSYTTSRYGTAKQHFIDIDDALDQSNGEVEITCNCDTSDYAYVYSDQPYTIYVCKSFWQAANTGTDSRAGTLVHEMSHFDVVAATDDVVYGQSGAKSLARSDPAQALNNADSHEFFAENTPAQN